MTLTMKINKKYYEVNVPELSDLQLSQEQIQEVLKKWFRTTAAYLTRLQVQKEDTVLKDNQEKLNVLIEYGVSLGLDTTQAATMAKAMLSQKDPNFRTERKQEFTFTAEDILNTLKVEKDEEDEDEN